jgi:NAD(P)-dependent dehydrogenase (short-subunit alcohol dehydrogenase family)
MRSVLSIVTSWVVNGSPYVVPSAMSKSAVHAMTMSLASEWGRYGTRLNAIGPGEIPTEGMNQRLMPGETPGAYTVANNPMGRTGRMDELQNLATFLMGDGCDWLTGQTIFLNGADHLATGGNFYHLREWDDARWQQARETIRSRDQKDRQAG